MTAGPDLWHVGETLVTIVPVAIGFIWAIKTDTKVLKTRLDNVDGRLEKMDGVMVMLAENKGRMDRVDDRLLMTGQRVDEMTRRINRWIDDKALKTEV
jgi:hypothetical protein